LVQVHLRIPSSALALNGGELIPQIEFVRSTLAPELKSFGKALGMTGGIIVRQVEPSTAEHDYEWEEGEIRTTTTAGYVFRLAILGGVGDCTQLSRLEEVCQEFCASSLTGELGTSPSVHVFDNRKPGALRFAFTGSYLGRFNDSSAAQNEGVLAWTPWTATRPSQFFEYMDAVKSRRLLDRWGTWRGTSARGEARDARGSHSLIRSHNRSVL
jgi:hypothetical protein